MFPASVARWHGSLNGELTNRRGFLSHLSEDQVFLSVVTLAELRHAIERMAAGRRQRQLSAWPENELPMRFEGGVLSIDAAIADACGKLVATREAVGRPVEAMDAFLAATAQGAEPGRGPAVRSSASACSELTRVP